MLNPSWHANSLVAVFTPIWSFLCSFVACMRCGLVCGFDTVSVLCARSVGIVDDHLLTCGRRRVGIGMAAFHCVGIAFVFGVVCPIAAHGFELDARASGGQSSDSVGAFNGSYVVRFFIIVCHGFVFYFCLFRRLETKLYGNSMKQLGAALARFQKSPAYASYGRSPAEPHCQPYPCFPFRVAFYCVLYRFA